MNSFLSVVLFLCVFMVISMMGSYLMLLIFLELIMFISFIFFFDLGSLVLSGYCFTYNLIFLVMMIFEGVFGLSFMVSLSRSEGSDFFISW